MARGIFRNRRPVVAKRKVFFFSAAPQLVYPISDVTDGNWTNESDNNTNLYASVDEVSASDADYIQSENIPIASACVLGLGSVTDPVSSSGYKLSYRYRKNHPKSARQDLVVRLKQNTTTIATWTHTDIAGDWTDAEQTLSGAEADSITDHAVLRVEQEATEVY